MIKVVYTCITGNYDILLPPLVVNKGWEHICFTNNKKLLEKKNVGSYKLVQIDNPFNLDPVRLARQQKILGFSVNEADVLIWHDANMRICCNLDDLVSKYLKDDIDLVLSKHPKRDCLYKEGKKCIDLKKDSEIVINKHLQKYVELEVPENNGLYETGILIRRKFNKDTGIFYYKWWEEIKKGSRRDQISLPYCFWKYKEFAPKRNVVNSKELKGNFVKLRHNFNEFGGKY